MTDTREPPRSPLARWRDSILFLAGLALIGWEAIGRDGAERPTLLVLYAAMIGLPAFLRADEKRQAQQGRADTDPDPTEAPQ